MAYVSYDAHPGGHFTAATLYGSQKKLCYGFDTKNVSIASTSLVVGPDCTARDCRPEPPAGFYDRTILTYASFTNQNPGPQQPETVRLHGGGVHVLYLAELAQRTSPDSTATLYVTIEYLHPHTLDGTSPQTSQSEFPYTVRLLTSYGPDTRLQYQETRTVTKTLDSAPVEDYWHTWLPYTPSEVVIFPCRGRPAVLVDRITPLPSPAVMDYQ